MPNNKLYNNCFNKINININNKKNIFLIKNNLLNKFSKKKLINLKQLNLITFKKIKSKFLINLNLYQNKLPFKNLNKWK